MVSELRVTDLKARLKDWNQNIRKLRIKTSRPREFSKCECRTGKRKHACIGLHTCDYVSGLGLLLMFRMNSTLHCVWGGTVTTKDGENAQG